MIYKEFDNIEISDIQTQFEILDRELGTTEYKRNLELSNKEQKREFLADISSFANSSGGDIFFGIDEKNGLNGFEIEDLDTFILTIEQVIRSGLAPRIIYRIKEFKISESAFIVFIRIEKSYSSPHQVVIFGGDKFYGRGENGKYKLDVHQLRESFIGTEKTKTKINDFIIDRISNIIINETPIQITNNNPKIIFHAIPVNSFVKNEKLNIKYNNGVGLENYSPISRRGNFGMRTNFDGVLTYSSSNLENGGSYLQIFRNGVIESVDTSIISPMNSTTGEKIIPSTYLEEKLIEAIHLHFCLLKSLNVKFPLILFLNIYGVKGYKLAASKRWELETILLDRNHLKFEEILLEDNFESSVKILKPWFDHLWQAFNYDGCGNYRSENEWTDGRVIRK